MSKIKNEIQNVKEKRDLMIIEILVDKMLEPDEAILYVENNQIAIDLKRKEKFQQIDVQINSMIDVKIQGKILSLE